MTVRHQTIMTALLAAGTALSPVVAMAAEGEAHGSGGGLPQLNPAFFTPQLFWLAVSFTCLYGVMSIWGVPRIDKILENRHKILRDNIDSAQALRDEAAKTMAHYESAMAEHRRAAQQTIAATVVVLSKEATERQHALATQLTDQIAAAEVRIQAARKTALESVHAVAADLTKDVTHHVAGITLASHDVEQAVQTAAQEIRA